MKYGKLILGIILLIGAGREYASASRQLGTLINPGVMLGVMLLMILCTWLIAGAFPRQQKLKIKSLEFVKFYLGSLIIVALVSIISLASYRAPIELIKINGIDVSIGECIKGSKKIVPDEDERREYCTCMAKKLANSEEIVSKYKSELQRGKIDKILTAIEKNGLFDSSDIQNCLDSKSLDMDWTSSLVNRLRNNWIEELRNTEFDVTNHIDKYCDCILKEYQKYPVNEVLTDEFNNSELAVTIDEKCTEESLK